MKRKLPRKWVAIVLLGLLLLLVSQIVSLLGELMSFGPISPP